jgi:cobalt-zinc-cadmium resistance protein CzcA
MVSKLIQWAVYNPLIVILLALALVGFGSYAFLKVNVEAYPDPAPAIIEVLAQYPGASAEEVERLVTIPLEVALAGMPGLQYTRSKSLAGLSHLRNQFEYGIDYYAARQEVINRLAFVTGLPAGVTPQISPFTPTGELIRYTLVSPTDSSGREIYTLYDLKALQDWVLDREFRRLPRIAGLTSFGGEVKRYEIRPDPEQIKRYGVTLQQIQNAISNANANVGAGYLNQGGTAINVRGVGLLGRGTDPMLSAQLATSPRAGAHLMRQAERERLDDIRDIVVTSVNNVPVRVRDLVVKDAHGDGVLVGAQPRLGRVSVSRPRKDEEGNDLLDADGKRVWHDQADTVQGILLMRKNEATELALAKGKEKVDELNKTWYALTDQSLDALREAKAPKAVIDRLLPLKNKEFDTEAHFAARLAEVLDKKDLERYQGILLHHGLRTFGKMLPGVQISLHFDLTGLLHVTKETVRENLLLGMVLVVVILLMFLSNVRSALIVAINIPLALFFAFTILFLRGKSANLLSIGAVDFGIIVDSSVIMVENIYRHLSSGENADKPLRERIIHACHEVERPLLFSTAIMVCAFIPLFTMRGPEGQIFGPMADTYAFALGGALLLALTVAPALCLLFFKKLQPTPDNFLVRYLKNSYLRQLERCLNHRIVTLVLFGSLGAVTLTVLAIPDEHGQYALGREFMPELEEGNLYIRGTFPVNISLDEASDKARAARAILRQYPEVALVASQVGRPDDGTDPTGFYNVEFSIPLLPEDRWPKDTVERKGWRAWLLGSKRARTKPELIKALNSDLDRLLPGIDWNFSQYIRDNVMESLSGVKGDNSVKIIGPDLDTLEKLAEQAKAILDEVPGVENAGIFRIKGQPNLEFTVDRQKCKRWNISVKDVENAIQTAVGGQAFTQMIEGEKTFDIALRWPEHLRGNEQAILDIPVDVTGNTTQQTGAAVPATNLSGGAGGPSPITTSQAMPALVGSMQGGTYNYQASTPRLLLRQLVTPVNPKTGEPDPHGVYLRSGASTIFREQGKRLIAVKFSVNNEKRDLAGAVAEAQQKVNPLMPPGYTTEWSGEFKQMEEAEERLMYIVPISLTLIFVLLYLSFRNLPDALVVLSNVAALSLGGIWALLLTGNNFSISAAVGFISIFGVAIMDGLLLVSYFNHMRAEGLPLREAIMQGAEKRVRPVMMTALTAIFGLLPAAFSTRIGAQTQRPLAIVVVGGMISTLFLTRYLMPVLYSFYGHREPPEGAGGMAH